MGYNYLAKGYKSSLYFWSQPVISKLTRISKYMHREKWLLSNFLSVHARLDLNECTRVGFRSGVKAVSVGICSSFGALNKVTYAICDTCIEKSDFGLIFWVFMLDWTPMSAPELVLGVGSPRIAWGFVPFINTMYSNKELR